MGKKEIHIYANNERSVYSLLLVGSISSYSELPELHDDQRSSRQKFQVQEKIVNKMLTVHVVRE